MMSEPEKKLTKAQYVRRLYEKRRALGLCVKCGRTPETSSAFCAACRGRHRASQAARRVRNSKTGTCLQCPAPVWREGASHCLAHRIEIRERRRELMGRVQRNFMAGSYVAEHHPRSLRKLKRRQECAVVEPKIVNLGFLASKAQAVGMEVA